MPDFEQFSKEALRAQDGKRVPLTLGVGGPIVGEAVFHYEEDTDSLRFDSHIDIDPVRDWLIDEVSKFSIEGE